MNVITTQTIKNKNRKIILEVPDSKADFAMEFLKSISFIKKAKRLAANEITNPALLKNIEAYEKGETTPTPLNLAELKAMIHARTGLHA